MKYGSKTDFIQPITNASLSPVSKRVYLQRLKVLVQENKRDIYYIITHPNDFIEWIKKTYTSEQTQKSYISAVLAVFRHNKGLKDQESKNYTVWYSAFNDIHARIDERYKKNEPTQHQKDVYVPYTDIVKSRDELEKGSSERLLFCMYTMLPPLRADFNKVRIYHSTVPNDPEKNYIIHRGNVATLVLQEFKTSKKITYEKDLPEELVKEIEASIEKNPRPWLFVDQKNKPFSAKSFTQWANRIFARVLGKRMTVSMIRHAYINNLDFNKLTVAEKEAIAKDMAHTVGTQDRYRLIFNINNDTKSQETKCEMVCTTHPPHTGHNGAE